MTHHHITFDLVGTRDGGVGAWVNDGAPSGAIKQDGWPVIIIRVGAVTGWFLTRHKPVTEDWCKDFLTRHINNDPSIERFDYSLLRMKMPSRKDR